jgi:hypothetical protein
MYSHTARQGITFYLVRALWCYFTGAEANALVYAEKGVVMVRECPQTKDGEVKNGTR